MIPLVEPEDLITGRKGTPRGRYTKYAQAIAPFVAEIKQAMTASKDGQARMRIVDIAKQANLPSKNETSVYWGLKYSLFRHDIYVETAKHNDGSRVLVMRARTPEDKLPPSLTDFSDQSTE